MKRIRQTFWIFCFFVIKGAYCQSSYVLKELLSQYKTKDDYVRKVYTDSSGIIWMRTFSKMLRYNGNSVEDFDNIIPQDFRLTDAFLFKTKILLNYNNEELKLFDTKLLTLVNVAIPKTIGMLKQIYILDEGHIFITNLESNITDVYLLLGCELVRTRQISNLATDDIMPINDSLFLFTQNSSLFLFNSFSNIAKLEISNIKLEDYAIKDSFILLLSLDKLRIYDFKNDKAISEFDIPNSEDGHNISITQNIIWILTNAGIYHFEKAQKQFMRCEFLMDNFNYRILKQSFDIHYIPCGNYYILSNYVGLFKAIRSSAGGISSYRIPQIFSNERDITFRCICFNSPTAEVFSSIDSKGVFSFVPSGDSLLSKKLVDNGNLKDRQIFNLNKIFIDSEQRKWLCGNSGLKILGSSKPDRKNFFRVWDVCSLNKNFWVIENTFSACYLHLLDNNGVSLKSFEFISKTRAQNYFWDIEPYQNYLLISSKEGLIAFDILSEKYVDSRDVFRPSESLLGRAWSCKANSRYLYIAYQDRGLRRVNLLTGEVFNPLPEIKRAFQIESSDSKNFWINSQDKLIYLKEDGSYFVLNTNNFPIPSDISFHGMYIDSEAMLWVCGKGGFAKIDINNCLENWSSQDVRTLVSGFLVNSELLYGILPDSFSLSLSYGSNNVVVDIANSLLDNGADIKIRYKLYGFDEEYSVSNGTNTIVYRNLPPGSYTLDIFVSNSLGLWDKSSTQLSIIIRSPWYNNTISQAVYLLLIILSLIGTYFLVRINRVKKKKRELVLIESELRGIRSQLNPHFLFNSLNSIQSYIVNDNSALAVIYLNKFAKLVRRVLDFATVETIELSSEIKWIHDYFELEALRFNGKFKGDIHCPDEIDCSSHVPALVLQPIIENAIIHGLFPKRTGGSILVSYSLNSDKKSITCQVTDDGVGRNYSSKNTDPSHTSKGTIITSQRLYFLGKKYDMECKLEIVDLINSLGEALGTKVTIILPILPKPSDE